jgi:hypothetical protein
MADLLAALMRMGAVMKTRARSLTAAKRVAAVMAAGALLAVLPVLPSGTALAAYATPCASVCYLGNLYVTPETPDGLGLVGVTHGSQLSGNTLVGDYYYWTNEDSNIWGLMHVNEDSSLCWNYVPAQEEVYIDSCETTDHNEWFAFVTCPGGTYCIKNYTLGTDPNLSADNTGPAYFYPALNDTSEWNVYYPSVISSAGRRL